MTDREVLEWWDYTTLRGYVFGPAKDIIGLDALLNHPERPRTRQPHKPEPKPETQS